MKNSFELNLTLTQAGSSLLEADRREIDNPYPYKPACRNYLDRIETVVNLAKKNSKPNAEIAEIGCAQGNMSLLLAEAGFQIKAIDINPVFLEYSQLKYQQGKITWLNANLEELKPELLFDAIILAEIIEHCAWPENVVRRALQHLKPSGILIVTTPNAEKIREHLPTFSAFIDIEKRKELEKMQFGPNGEDHLFLFTMKEMVGLKPPEARVIDRGYLGGTLMLNSWTHHIFRFLPLKLYRRFIRGLAHLPLIDRYTFHNIYMVIQK